MKFTLDMGEIQMVGGQEPRSWGSRRYNLIQTMKVSNPRWLERMRRGVRVDSQSNWKAEATKSRVRAQDRLRDDEGHPGMSHDE